MTARDKELEAAAEDIDPESLRSAKAAVAVGCEEQLRWIEMLSMRLDTVGPGDLPKFTRALALTMLGHLPTRPGTCPFCLQYGSDRGCLGCGYALTHGRCDSDDSAFSLFIEAFQELGRAIYQDTEGRPVHPDIAKELLQQSLERSKKTARQMQEVIFSASALQLMELKASYLKNMICHLPVKILSYEVEMKSKAVVDHLKNYW